MSEQEAMSSKPQPGQLVVVDDDQATGVLVLRRLAKSSWTATNFTSGHAAIEYLSANTPAVLLIDIRMPMIDGDEVLAALQAAGRLHPETRIFVASSVEPLAEVWRKFQPFNATFVTKDELRDKGRLLELLDEAAAPTKPTINTA